MACPTCSKTMQRIASNVPRQWWCPSCGTLRTENAVPECEEPKLVHRAFQLCEAASDHLAGIKTERLEYYERAVRECCQPD